MNCAAHWQLGMRVPIRDAEDAGASLIEAGALGVVTIGEDEASGQTTLTACYAATWARTQLVPQAVTALAEVGVGIAPEALSLALMPSQDYAQSWKTFFVPLQVGRRVWVVPSWRDDFVAPPDAIVLVMDPGMAFGTGQHATTSLCLRAIESFYDARAGAGPRPHRMLDAGCGSGILAVCAAKFGAADVVAVDHDGLAVEAAAHNAASNGVAEQMRCANTPVAEVTGRFDLVVANIEAHVLMAMAPALVQRLALGGELVLSGLLDEQVGAVEAAVVAAGRNAGRRLRRANARGEGEWSSVTLVDAVDI